MDVSTALDWAADRKHAVLITLRADGRPQSSDVVYAIKDGQFVVSVTDDRAKTANMRRDPRVVVHISVPEKWSYVSCDAEVELSEPTREPGDATSDALVDYFQRVSGEHDDWDEYRRAMVDEKRLVATITPRSAVGQING